MFKDLEEPKNKREFISYYTQVCQMKNQNNVQEITIPLEDLFWLCQYGWQTLNKPNYWNMTYHTNSIELTEEDYKILPHLKFDREKYRKRHKQHVEEINKTLSDDDPRIRKLIKYV